MRQLRELGDAPRATYLADFRLTESAKYLLIVATEAAIDICNHIVARLGGKAPGSYADCFLLLGNLGIVSEGLATKLQQMARFRNLLVHRYGDVDDNRVYDIIQADLGEIDSFREAIARWLTAADK